ncbi:MAG: ATP-binding protein, partial [Acidobacteria bacterium]|nr:ATP-binding protein [Acidobacteriota bacterium]
MEKRRILIVDANEELRTLLSRVLADFGHEVVATGNREEALARDDLEDFDLVISDLTDDDEGGVQIVSELKRKSLLVPVVVSSDETHPAGVVKAFKMGAANYVRRPYRREELRDIVEKTLSYKLRFIEDVKVLPFVHEKIEFELPSDLSLMNGVLHYLHERVVQLGLINPERSNLFIALDEAFVNAVKHGNRQDPHKLVRITADLSAQEARFTVEDEGEGFRLNDIPDPTDPANLFKTSGRGVLLIYNIMDEVMYNERGNRLTMIKRPEETLEHKLIDKLTPEDDDSAPRTHASPTRPAVTPTSPLI